MFEGVPFRVMCKSEQHRRFYDHESKEVLGYTIVTILVVHLVLLIYRGADYHLHNIFSITELQSGGIRFHLTLLAKVAVIFRPPFIVIY